jgi:hypothetical protein
MSIIDNDAAIDRNAGLLANAMLGRMLAAKTTASRRLAAIG